MLTNILFLFINFSQILFNCLIYIWIENVNQVKFIGPIIVIFDFIQIIILNAYPGFEESRCTNNIFKKVLLTKIEHGSTRRYFHTSTNKPKSNWMFIIGALFIIFHILSIFQDRYMYIYDFFSKLMNARTPHHYMWVPMIILIISIC